MQLIYIAFQVPFLYKLVLLTTLMLWIMCKISYVNWIYYNWIFCVYKYVNKTFNLTSFNYNISILEIDIESAAKYYLIFPIFKSFILLFDRDSNSYSLFVDILFTISSNCNITCIDQLKTAGTSQLSLPAANGTFVSVTSNSAPVLQSRMFIHPFHTYK